MRLEYDGREILEARIAAGMTVQDLADAVGCKPSIIRAIEAEQTERFGISTARKMAAVLGVPFERLTRPAPEPRPPSTPVDPRRGFAGSARHNHGGDKPKNPRLSSRRRMLRQAPPADETEVA